GIESIRIAQAPKVEPRSEECVLHRILGRFVITQDQARRGMQAPCRPERQGSEGIDVARLCSFDEVTLHLTVPRWSVARLPLSSSLRRETPDLFNLPRLTARAARSGRRHLRLC